MLTKVWSVASKGLEAVEVEAEAGEKDSGDVFNKKKTVRAI